MFSELTFYVRDDVAGVPTTCIEEDFGASNCDQSCKGKAETLARTLDDRGRDDGRGRRGNPGCGIGLVF